MHFVFFLLCFLFQFLDWPPLLPRSFPLTLLSVFILRGEALMPIEVIKMSQEGGLNCDFANFSINFNLFELLPKIALVFRKS